MASIKIRDQKNPMKVWEVKVDNLEGTQKQIDYAVIIICKKVENTLLVCYNRMKSGKMTQEEINVGMERLINQLESMTSAKYVIENVK